MIRAFSRVFTSIFVYLFGGCALLLCLTVMAVDRPEPFRPKAILDTLEAELLKTKNFDAQNRRLLTFNCIADLKEVEANYLKQRRLFLEAENILDSEKRGQISFTSLPPSERQKLAPLFPEGFGKFVAQMNNPGIAGERLALLLSAMMRETDLQMFLDEGGPGVMLQGPGTRPGAGLMQMTAWNLEYVEKWGPHDYDKYDQERLRDLIENFQPKAKVSGPDFRTSWLPAHVELGVKKDDLATAKQFIQSPYNPVAAFWYGNFVMKEAEEKVGELGIRNMKAGDRAAILGVFYNAGMERMRCVTERVKIWNDFFGSLDIAFKKGSYELKANEWDSLRPMLYLDSDMLKAGGLPDDLILKLSAACKDKAKCTCLDQEPTTAKSALKGNDFKGGVSVSYGNHMRMLNQCLTGYVDEHHPKVDSIPSHCR